MIYTLYDVDLLTDVPFRGDVVNAAHLRVSPQENYFGSVNTYFQAKCNKY